MHYNRCLHRNTIVNQSNVCQAGPALIIALFISQQLIMHSTVRP
jgi:hypothetical protein